MSKLARWTTLLAFALAVASTTARAGTPVSGAVHTDLSQVRACVALSGGAGDSGARAGDPGEPGSVLAATGGGVALVSPEGEVRAVWTALDGLPGTDTRTILRDRGTLWIGSEQGLAQVRLAGERMEIIATYPSRPVHAIARFAGHVYVGTWGGGVLRLGVAGLEPVPSGEAGAVPGAARVTALAVWQDTLVAATAGSGIWEMREQRLRPMAVQDREVGRVPVWSLAARGDELWAGTMTGLYRIREDGAVRLGDRDVRHVQVAGGEVLAATFGQGIFQVRENGLVPLSRLPDAAEYVYSMADGACIATHHGLWVKQSAGAGAGAWRKARLSGLPSNDIAALAADGERLWAGTFDQGLAVYEGGRWRSVQDPAMDPKINALAAIRGRLWVATSSGLSVFDGEQVTRLDQRDGLPSSHVLAVAPLRDGGVIAGTAQGAALIRDREITVIGRKQGIFISNVWAAAEDPSGAIWLGTTKGLYRVEAGGAWQRFSVATGHLGDDWVMAIAMAGDTLWAGTYKGGVVRFDRRSDGSYVASPVTGGPGAGWINPGGLTWHDGTLYAATMDGLWQGDGRAWQRHERVTPGPDTTAVAAQGDHLWIAGRRGLRALPVP